MRINWQKNHLPIRTKSISAQDLIQIHSSVTSTNFSIAFVRKVFIKYVWLDCFTSFATTVIARLYSPYNVRYLLNNKYCKIKIIGECIHIYPKIKALNMITNNNTNPIALCFRLNAIKAPTLIAMSARSVNIV